STKQLLSKIHNINNGKILDEWNNLKLRMNNIKIKDINNDVNLPTQKELDINNVKRMCKLIQGGNIYKGYQQLDSQGIASLNDKNFKLLDSKFIKNNKPIHKLNITHNVIKLNADIIT